MDEDNNNPPPNRPYRVRRPSSSLISSTTSPIFPVPPNPLLRSSIGRVVGGSGGSSSPLVGPAFQHQQQQPQQQQHRDIDEEPSSSLSSSSFTAPSSRQRAGFSNNQNANASTSGSSSSSSNYMNTRSSSPLGSPDSTFWGPSQSPGPVNSNLYRNASSSSSSASNNNNANNHSIAGPPTPGGMCVVSSSTVDDIPPSPFSPASLADDSNSSSVAAQNVRNASSGSSNSVSVISENSNNPGSHESGASNQAASPSAPGPSSAMHSSPLLQGSLSRTSSLANAVSVDRAAEGSSSTGVAAEGSGNGQYSSSSFSSPSSSSYLSPLSKKIKKASSFERFSAQAQASINSSIGNASNNDNVAAKNIGNNDPAPAPSRQEVSANRIPNRKYSLLHQQTSTSASTSSGSGGALPGPSRLLWDLVPNESQSSALANDNTSNQGSTSAVGSGGASRATGSNSSSQDASSSNSNNCAAPASIPPLQFNSKPFHIKKYAAKIAVLEQSKFGADDSSLAQFPPLRSSINSNAVSAVDTLSTDNFLNDLHADSPLNLTENSSTSGVSNANSSSLMRTPIQKSFSKRVPMPPKQKILQRMQSGEIFDGISPPPPGIQLQSSTPLSPPAASSLRHSSSPPMSTSQLQQQLQSQLMQQQDHVLHQQLHESLQQQQHQQSLMESMSSSLQQSPQTILDRYSSVSNCDALTRSNMMNVSGPDDFNNVQDALSKSNIDCGNDPGILYEDVADAYAYYYGLGDEIFANAPGGSGNNAGPSNASARPLLMMPGGSGGGAMGMQDEMAMGNIFQSQSHGHLEFVLSNMNHGNQMGDDNGMQQQHERMMAANREMEDLQLGDVGIENGAGGNVPCQHVQFLDPNDVNNSLSKIPSDSTLRNLLMMQPLRSHDDSWIAASNEYQNSLRSLSAGSGLPTNSILGNALLMNSASGGNSSASGTNWMNDGWAARSLWQQQQHVQHDQQTDDDSGGDQDEVMDMSIMEAEKSHSMSTSSSSIIVKRSVHNHNQALLDHNGAENLSLEDVDLVSERELLASGGNIPQLHGIPLDLQLQQHIQQQPLGLNMFGKNSMLDSSASHLAAMDQQQHHRSSSVDNDEPVNLIASTNSVQELMQQHHHHHSSNSHHIMNDGSTSCIVTSQDPNNSCMTILTTTSSTTLTSAGNNFSNNFESMLNSNNLTAEEKRIIHYKKLKEAESFNLSRGGGGNANMPPSPPTANFIPDKPVQPKAFGSLPSPLSLVRDEDNTWRVFNRHKTIPCNTRFGPVEGPMKKVYESDFHNMSASIYPYLVIVDESTVLLQLDRTLDEMCNWMKFVRLARTPEEQNALISESNNLIYFTTCRDILPKAELRVGYSLEYAEKFGFHYMEPITSNPIDAYSNCSDQGEGELEIEYEAPSILTVAKRQKGRTSKSEAVQYACFECEADFGSIEELRTHLNNAHDNEPEEMIRRPKKKVLKKYYNSENINPSVSPAPPSANRSSEYKAEQVPKISLDVKQSSSAVSSQNSTNSVSGSQSLIKEVTGSKYEKFPRKKAAMENALVQDSGNQENLPSNSSKSLVASSITSTTAAAVPVVVKRKNKCSICYKSFASKDRLDRHFMAHCDDACKPLKCPTCSKRFLTNSALAGHVKTHSDGKCFECPLCEFSTQQLLQLKEHVQTHRNTQTGFFHCHRCTKKFAQYSMVRKHIRAFHGPRTFQCDHEHCTMKFPTSDKLKLHKLKHSDHREFLCAECGHQFKRRDKLVEHTKRMHADGKKKPVQIPILPTPPAPKKLRLHKKFMPKLTSDELEKFTFRCTDCSIGFKRRGMLVNHLAKRHPERTLQHVPELNLPIIKPARDYYCLYCERVYKSSSKRKSHSLKSHPGKPLPPQLRGKQSKVKADEVAKVETIKTPDQQASFVSSDENGVSASGIQSKRVSLYNDAGKVVSTPHACQWCHRQYATRAKLLQHQRKNHLHLMPPDIQTPRTQKNNVRKNNGDSSSNSSSASSPLIQQKLQMTPGTSKEASGQIIQFQHTKTVSESNVSGSDEVIGFFLTTNITNGDLNSLLQQAPELVVVPMTSLPSTLNSETIASITSTSGNNNLTLSPVSTAGSSSRVSTSRLFASESLSKDNSQTSNNLNN